MAEVMCWAMRSELQSAGHSTCVQLCSWEDTSRIIPLDCEFREVHKRHCFKFKLGGIVLIFLCSVIFILANKTVDFHKSFLVNVLGDFFVV